MDPKSIGSLKRLRFKAKIPNFAFETYGKKSEKIKLFSNIYFILAINEADYMLKHFLELPGLKQVESVYCTQSRAYIYLSKQRELSERIYSLAANFVGIKYCQPIFLDFANLIE